MELKDNFSVINICSGEEISVADFARLIGVDQIHIGTGIGKLEGTIEEITEIKDEIENEIKDKNKYIFTLVENTHTSLLHEDDLILNHLFGKRGGARRASVTVDTKSSRDTTGDVIIRGTKKVLTKFLEKEMNKRFFHLNRKYIWKGLAFSVLVLIITGNGDVTTLFPIIWLSIWTSGVVVLVSQAVKIWKPIIHSEKNHLPN